MDLGAARKPMKPYRILIADDHEIVRRGLRVLLQNREGWEICGEASDGMDAVSKVLQLKPDLAILDIKMPKLNGLEATRQIMQHEPQTAVLVLTIDESEHVFREAVKAGAKGFLHKSEAARSLKDAVESLQRGQQFVTSQNWDRPIEGRMHDRNPAGLAEVGRNRLTPRELEIVQLLAEGKTSKEVSALLGISVKTTETHRSNIMRKLNFHSVSQLVMYAVRNNLLRMPQEP
ncbi:MAG TPA: response regulator transcription factor [Terriglobales bacterium]|jgi:DNA-binding NarL/FixJ family response regulator